MKTLLEFDLDAFLWGISPKERAVIFAVVIVGIAFACALAYLGAWGMVIWFFTHISHFMGDMSELVL